MKTTEMLLAADYLSDDAIQADIGEIHSLVVTECNKSKNIVKLTSGVGVFAGMMGSSDNGVCKKAIKTILFLLYHNFPSVRQLAAEKLYTGLLTMESTDHVIPGGEDAYDEVNELLSETNWAQNSKKLADETKVKMYAYFGHEAKMPAAK